MRQIPPISVFIRAALCLCLTAQGGCGEAGAGKPNHQPSDTRKPTLVSLGPVRVGSVWRTVEVTGTLYGEEETTIASKLGGRVASLAVDVGDDAPSGSVLGQIEPRDYELALAEAEATMRSSLARLGLESLPTPGFDVESLPSVRRARAEAANAAAKADRARRLYEQEPPLISEQDYADIRTSNDVAQQSAATERLQVSALIAEARAQSSSAEVARQRLADTVVRVPSSSAEMVPLRYQVASRSVSVGEYVAPGQAMFHLVAADRVDFRADVVERFAGQIRTGQEVLVWVESSAEPVTGVVTRISPRIDTQSRTFMVEIRIDNRDWKLRPGAFARGQIRLREERDLTFVPADAAVTFAGVTRVFSVENGRAKGHRVRTGVRQGNDVEIEGGLPVREVVVHGAASLAEGVPVTIEARPAD